jgi:hypothetical protein
MILRG